MFKLLRERLSLADVVLFLLIVVALMLSAAYQWKPQSRQAVFIYKDNLLYGEYPLDRDREIELDEHNTVRITGGRVMMQFSDCPNQRCVKQGATSKLPIICLPNNVVVEIKSDESERLFITR